ncbi:MAG: hypothetical protein JWP89_5263 [Schlesneria sp.]|nr:hypothetical protein [Schlesneria sp.]
MLVLRVTTQTAIELIEPDLQAAQGPPVDAPPASMDAVVQLTVVPTAAVMLAAALAAVLSTTKRTDLTGRRTWFIRQTICHQQWSSILTMSTKAHRTSS